MKNNLLKLPIFLTFLTTGSYAQEGVFEHDQKSKHSFIQQKIICEDGSKFSIAANAGLPKSIAIAKKDGPIVYVEDKEGRLYSLEFNEKAKKLERTKIFRLPIVGRLYSWLWDKSNIIQLPRINNENFAKWAISYFTYPEGLDVRTISLFIMTQTNPVKIRNMDPWLLPWNIYEHEGPLGITGVDIAAGGETVAIIGYQKNSQKVFAYRRLNYDLTGGNPMIHYRLQGGYVRAPSYLMQLIAKKIGVTQKVIDIPVPDWKVVPLNDDDQPKIKIDKNGQHVIVHKNDGKSRVYDCYFQRWVKDIDRGEKVDLPISWPDYEPPVQDVSASFKGRLNVEKGTFVATTQEPIIGNFFNKKGEKTAIYALSPTFWSVFTNVKYLYDATYRQVQLQLLGKKD